MRLAKIEDGKIVNIIEADDVIDGYVAMPGSAEECGIGDNFINGEFARDFLPPPWSPDPLLKIVKAGREIALNRLTGVGRRADKAGNTALSDACDAAIESLLAITTLPTVLAATDDASLTAAVAQAYGAIVAQADPEIVKAFRDIQS